MLAGLALLAACYSPTLRDCTVGCSAATDCSGAQVCGADGFCASPELAGQCLGSADARPASDGTMVSTDAPADASPCALGCTNGTCVGGVCVIDCSAPDSCPNDVECPADLPCRVVCGDQSCGQKILCALATSCEVSCQGTNSCSDEIICGSGPCSVSCAGYDSCDRRIKCKEACSCDATCTGISACGEAPECPLGATCRVGNGCTAALPVCDTCP